MHLGHRPVDAPGLTHLAPVEHELLRSRSQFHGLFRHVCTNSLSRKGTQKGTDRQVWAIRPCRLRRNYDRSFPSAGTCPPCPSRLGLDMSSTFVIALELFASTTR